jgi:hypothetical protein
VSNNGSPNHSRQATQELRRGASWSRLVRRGCVQRWAALRVVRVRAMKMTRLMAVVVAAVGAFLSFSAPGCPIEGPDEDVTLAHFWVFSVGDADFGIREWNCSGNANARIPARTYTTLFLGWTECSTHLPAFAVIAIAFVGLSVTKFFGFTARRRFGRTSV